MDFFLNWLKEKWNDLIDLVPFSEYKNAKSRYEKILSGEKYLSKLFQDNSYISVRDNLVLLLFEKWLYRQAAANDKDHKGIIKNNIYARISLLNRYCYNDLDGFFYDCYHEQQVNAYKPIDQFIACWCALKDFSKSNIEKLLEESNKDKEWLFCVFMGLRRLGFNELANSVGKTIGYEVDNYDPSISTNTQPLLRYCSPEESLKMISDAGFKCFDFSMEYENPFFASERYVKNAEELKCLADKLGLLCNQTHSIFPVFHKSIDVNESGRRINFTKRILEISKILGAKNCVIHPINDWNEEKNCAFFQEFLPLAEKFDLNIATENMWNWLDGKASLAACSNHENYKRLIDMVNHPKFCACVDVGHAEMYGLETSAPKMIETLGQKVTCLHLHDNDMHYDRHSLPFSEKIDFELILDSLARVNYKGDLTFECDGFIDRMPRELHHHCLKTILSIGNYLKGELLIRRKAKCKIK